ncbi:Ribosome biogenesis protein Alb1 [Akanthomyces lecanii RCEF 1005]|uniref:Ribosome biogenesis protein Alb1 n=1 Tax=Akanthomyces lecanii RCEF 1005 TaxID=1081108 RepID=A0A168I7S9_CORDF|nr:Ribosome biogenesis protein Alb1 [Akanthomyces lecanii RCEF 1005]
MAKAKTQPSKRSRAARRATSPSIDTDKSLKTAQPPPRTKPTDRPSVLAVQHAAGVQKRSSHRKTHLSAKARKRREKGMEMAEAVMERTSNKVQRSLNRQRTVDKRRKEWDAINKDVNEAEGDEDEDDEDMEVEEEGVETKKKKKKNGKKETKKAEDKDKEDGWETDEGDEPKTTDGGVDDGLDEIL